MAKQRSKQYEPSKTGPLKFGFDGEEDSWVFVKKQRVIIVLPSLPLPEHFTPEKPETSQSQAELRDGIADMQAEATPVHHTVVVPSLPIPEQFILQKPETSQSQAELRVDMRGTSLAHTMVPSRHVSEHSTLQKPETSQSQPELGADKHETTLVHTVVPSLQSQADVIEDAHIVVPSVPVTEHGILEKPAASRSKSVLRGLVGDTHVYTVEPEACPDFTAVDKPEIVRSRNLATRKAPAQRRSHQDIRTHASRRVENHRSRTRRKPLRFPRVMCSSVVMDNEKLRVVNLEKKVEKAGGLNEWVGSIGLGREFERMLRGQRMNKFQVANLTMEKLKHMGALAVGPRRKLIHAIHCVYHPHCLRASFN
ncbi:unnamed protein product [Microthlaspi erraticum]|uniref:SAM domain-containing protein n=1 Tax=Microthlaspi erraticum TaxID=1685480 RepID=A0A6D2HSK2_9BRAS|nr:unnamed protein product [Microthlaspi erraticum]